MTKKLTSIVFLWLLVALTIEQANCKAEENSENIIESVQPVEKKSTSQVYLGGGCFWCVEAMFEDLKGVTDVESGYSGGFLENPTYKQVRSGKTGHAEVIKIDYESNIISFKELIYLFMHAHDPTTYHRQGIDSGSQYRSVLFYQTEEELRIIKTVLKELECDQTYTNAPETIVTEICFFGKYYPAEKHHQDYFSANPYDQECSAIIAPKVQKMRTLFKSYYQ